MKQTFIIQEENPKLLLLFAGWACDETLFKQYRPQGMDFMVCYDYRSLDFDYSVLKRYKSVNVVSWSLGVWVGAIVLSSIPNKDIFSIAFNGSTFPIDDSEGIPRDIYMATLEGLTPVTLQKFMRRMCKDSNAYKALMAITPRRDFEEIKEELKCFKEKYSEMLGPLADEDTMDPEAERQFSDYQDKYNYAYSYCFFGMNDKIFPYRNLFLNQEVSGSKIILTRSAHYDEAMFRFLLQDMWNMPIDNFLKHLKRISVE